MSYSKIDIKKKYYLPDNVIFCKKCVQSNQRPRISFDAKGICNACNHFEEKKSINWKEREEALKDLLNQYRRTDGRFDILVPSSGGKDSAVVAHQLKYKYNMNPLTVTWSPNAYTDIGFKNFQGLIKAGLPNLLGSPSGEVNRRLVKDCLIELGDPFQPWIYGCVGFPMQIAVNYDIKIIMDGENGELEYGGEKSAPQNSFSKEDEKKFWFSNFELEKWLDKGYSKKDLNFYSSPSEEIISEKKIIRRFWSDYHKWLPQENYYYASENTFFQANDEGRSEGTYSKYASLDDMIDGFHYYFMYLKFGYGRCTSDAAHEIREGLIDRKEGVSLVKKFDGEFPKKYFKFFLEYINLSENDFWSICEKWRGEHVFEKKNNNWILKKEIT